MQLVFFTRLETTLALGLEQTGTQPSLVVVSHLLLKGFLLCRLSRWTVASWVLGLVV